MPGYIYKACGSGSEPGWVLVNMIMIFRVPKKKRWIFWPA